MTTKTETTKAITHNSSTSVAARMGAGARPSSPPPVGVVGGDANVSRLTRSGKPDRRYMGQRDLPPDEVANDYAHATSGFVDENGIHRTNDGAPDVRFKENRALSPEQTRISQAEWVLAQAKSKK